MSAAPPHVPTRRSLETLGASFSDTSAVVRALHNGYTTGQAGTGENGMMGQVVDGAPPDPDRIHSWPFMWSRAKVAPMRRGLGQGSGGVGLGDEGTEQYIEPHETKRPGLLQCLFCPLLSSLLSDFVFLSLKMYFQTHTHTSRLASAHHQKQRYIFFA